MFRSDGLRKAPLRRISAWISAWLSLFPAVALAQAGVCNVPERLEAPVAVRPPGEAVVNVPVRRFTLALSWSPQFCRTHADDGQCQRTTGSFGFIVHGLWPDGVGTRNPAWCKPAAPIPAAVARAQFCATPSARLIAHEWAKHGTCATNDPAAYFAASRKLYGLLRFPDMDALSRRGVTVGEFKQMMAARNRTIPVSAMVVQTSGPWLSELQICLDEVLRPARCPAMKPRNRDTARLKIWRN